MLRTQDLSCCTQLFSFTSSAYADILHTRLRHCAESLLHCICNRFLDKLPASSIMDFRFCSSCQSACQHGSKQITCSGVASTYIRECCKMCLFSRHCQISHLLDPVFIVTKLNPCHYNSSWSIFPQVFAASCLITVRRLFLRPSYFRSSDNLYPSEYKAPSDLGSQYPPSSQAPASFCKISMEKISNLYP